MMGTAILSISDASRAAETAAPSPATSGGEGRCASSAAGEEPPASGEKPRRCGGNLGLGVEVVDATGVLPPTQAAWLGEQLARAAEIVRAKGEARLRLVGDVEMAHAHEVRMGVPGTTDVITFDLTDGGSASGELVDVDLLICVDEANRQAAPRGHGLEHELLLYAVHGLLHCLGHDDLDEESSRVMHQEEDRILCALGLGQVFGAPEKESEK